LLYLKAKLKYASFVSRLSLFIGLTPGTDAKASSGKIPFSSLTRFCSGILFNPLNENCSLKLSYSEIARLNKITLIGICPASLVNTAVHYNRTSAAIPQSIKLFGHLKVIGSYNASFTGGQDFG